MDNRTPDEGARIVEVFAQRRASYDVAEVLRLTLVTRERLEEAISKKHVDPILKRGEPHFRWEDVAHLALERWTPREIARALEDAGHADAQPVLNQFRAITIELPLYQIRLLHYLAEQETSESHASRSVSDILEREVSQLTIGVTEDLERRFPGFAAAAHFPNASASHPARRECLYCGRAVEGSEYVCLGCVERHVPQHSAIRDP